MELVIGNNVLIPAGTAFGALVGALLTHHLAKRKWERESRHDVERKRYQDSMNFLDDLSRLIGRRFYLTQRIVWQLEAPSPSQESLDDIVKRYYDVLFEWNTTYWSNRNKIRLFLGERFANSFLDYADDDRTEDPVSLHYRFRRAHQLVMSARAGNVEVSQAGQFVSSMNKACSYFLEDLAHDLVKRALSEQLRKMPGMEDSRSPADRRRDLRSRLEHAQSRSSTREEHF